MDKFTDTQEKTLELLATGQTVSEVATEVGLDVAILSQWRKEPEFIAELNRRRHETWGSARDRLRALIPKAVDTLEQAVEEGNVRAAVEILKAASVYGKVEAPSGAVDPELIVVQQAKAWAEGELAKRGPSEDGLDILMHDQYKVSLTQERLQELRAGVV